MISIIDYKDEHQEFFEKFNRYWIEKYFEMEELDEFVLTKPAKAILKPGGAILMGLYNGEVAGTVALRKLDAGLFEFTKMAVDDKYQRKGIAEALSIECFRVAYKLGADSIILYTNSMLTSAIKLYEKLGFKHITIGHNEYRRSDVKMSISIDEAIKAASEFSNDTNC